MTVRTFLAHFYPKRSATRVPNVRNSINVGYFEGEFLTRAVVAAIQETQWAHEFVPSVMYLTNDTVMAAFSNLS